MYLRVLRFVCLAGALALAAAPMRAQDAGAGEPEQAPEQATEEAPAPTSLRPHLDFGFEIKANFRDSEQNRFAVPFAFPPEQLPPGETRGFEQTVDGGSHFELSTATLLLDATWSPALVAHLKIDFIDLHDRNPTSTDHNVDVDEAWIRFGRQSEPATLPQRPGAYLKVGKMAKFERQNDRHLESYGLVSTAFNRFEDSGVEAGVDLGRHLYLKASYTTGNPLFMRDPNALAGDNGTDELLRPFPDPQLKSGVVILYDAEVEDFDVSGDPETGAGLGLRFADADGRNGVDLLAYGYRRKLADTVALNGTFYGGDLDLLRGPENDFPFPLTGDEKREAGGNLWLYLGDFSFFGQYVDQDVGGLRRTGYEAEAAWRFELPLRFATGGRQLFPSIAPAVRYSHLEPDFAAPAVTPSPSFAWPWTKIDWGVRVGIVSGIDLTVEYADNDFVLKSGAHRSNNELLATLRWRG
jgi:hypothetical protein